MKRPASFLENAADHLTLRRGGRAMLFVFCAWATAFAAALPLWLGPPGLAGTVVFALLVGGLLLLQRSLDRRYRADPLPLTWMPPSRWGLSTRASAIGYPATMVAFFVVMALASGDNRAQATALLLTGVGLGFVTGSMGACFLVADRRKWANLDALLRERPEVGDRLREVRAGYPADAPFPFAAPGDGVRL